MAPAKSLSEKELSAQKKLSILELKNKCLTSPKRKYEKTIRQNRKDKIEKINVNTQNRKDKRAVRRIKKENRRSARKFKRIVKRYVSK